MPPAPGPIHQPSGEFQTNSGIKNRWTPHSSCSTDVADHLLPLSSCGEWSGRALDLLVRFLLDEIKADAAALTISDGEMLLYRASAGAACLIGTQNMQAGASSIIIAPFRSGETAGFVEVFSSKWKAFRERDTIIVHLVAAVIARAIHDEAGGSRANLNLEVSCLVEAVQRTTEQLNDLAVGRYRNLARLRPLHAHSVNACLVRQSSVLFNDPRGSAVVSMAGSLEPLSNQSTSNPEQTRESQSNLASHRSYSRPTLDSLPPTTCKQRLSALNGLGKAIRYSRVNTRKMALGIALILSSLIVRFSFRLDPSRGITPHSTSHIVSRSKNPRLSTRAVLEPSHMSLTDDPVVHQLNHTNVMSVPDLHKSAQAGNSVAQFQLGMDFEMGIGTEQSCTRAAAWIAKAADQGYGPAEYNLGLRYWNGDGVWVDRAQSIRWLERAAQHGSFRAAKLVKEASEN